MTLSARHWRTPSRSDSTGRSSVGGWRRVIAIVTTSCAGRTSSTGCDFWLVSFVEKAGRFARCSATDPPAVSRVPCGCHWLEIGSRMSAGRPYNPITFRSQARVFLLCSVWQLFVNLTIAACKPTRFRAGRGRQGRRTGWFASGLTGIRPICRLEGLSSAAASDPRHTLRRRSNAR